MTAMSAGVALVTGGSSGIGEATARRLHELGYVVYAAARRVDLMAPLATAGIHTVRADVTEDADLVALVDRIISERGRIDVLVNNAGYGLYGSLEEVSPDDARRQVEVNLLGLARLIQLVIPHMRARGRGLVVNVSSIGGKLGEPFGCWYHATKFAVEGLSDSLRPELAPFGIHVVVVEPGAVRTEWGAIAGQHLRDASAKGPYAARAAAAASVLESTSGPSRLSARPELVAEAIARATTSRRPRTRYVVPTTAKVILLFRRLLPDRAFDRLLALGYRMVAIGSR